MELSSSSSTWALGIGLGLGIPLLLLMILGIWLFFRGRVQKRRMQKYDDGGAWRYAPIRPGQEGEEL